MTTSTQTLVIGTRVYCVLHYCGRGIVYAIHGEQRPDTVRTFMGRWRVGWRGACRCCVRERPPDARGARVRRARHPVADLG